MKSIFLLIISFLLAAAGLRAQLVVDVQNSDLEVCGDAMPMRISVSPTVGMDSLRLRLNFPAGIAYHSLVVVSATAGLGAAEFDLSNPNEPIIAITSSAANFRVGAGDNIVLEVRRRALCGAIVAATSGFIFKDTLAPTAVGLVLPIDSDPTVDAYDLAYGVLSIISAPDVPLYGIGATGTRVLQIVNGGTGCVSGFELVRTTQAGISAGANIRVNGATISPSTVSGNVSTYLITSTDIGLGACIDNGESIIVEDDLEVLACAQLGTTYRLNWGCESAICQTTAPILAVVVLPAGVPNLISGNYNAVFSGTNMISEGNGHLMPVSLRQCYAENQPMRVCTKIKNIGTGAANSVRVVLFNNNFLYEWIDTASISVVYLSDSSHAIVDTVRIMNNAGCASGNFNLAGFTIPLIGAGDSVLIYFDINACCPNLCNDVYDVGQIYQSVRYLSPCRDTSYTDAWVRGLGRSFGFFSENNPPSVGIGDTGIFISNVDYADLSIAWSHTNNYTYRYQVILPPCGLIPTGRVVWQHVLSQSIWLPYQVLISGDTVTAFFNPSILAEPLNFGVSGSRLIFEAVGSCATCYPSVPLTARCDPAPPVYTGTVQKRLDLISCPNAAAPCARSLHCAAHTLTLVPCLDGSCADGFVMTGLNLERTSLGQADSDNNGQADGSGTLDRSRIALGSYVEGDTAQLTIRGYVAQRDSIMRTGYIELNLDTMLTWLGGDFIVWDSSTNTTYNCPAQLVSRSVSGAQQQILLSFTPDTICGTNNFLFGNGDTVRLSANFIVSHQNPDGSNRLGAMLTARGYTASRAVPLTCLETLICGGGNLFARYNIFAVTYGVGLNVFGTTNFNCQQSEYVISPRLFVNDFPFEYREIARLDTLVIVLPSGWQYLNTTYTYTTLTTQPSVVGDTLIYVFNHSKDDGISFYHHLHLQANCQSATPPMISYRIAFSNLAYQGNNLDNIPFDSRAMPPFAKPQLSFTNVSTPIVQGVTDTAVWRIRVANSNVSDAPFVFISYPSSSSINIHRLRNIATGIDYMPNNGIFELGAILRTEAIEFNVYATYTNCNLDSVPIFMGWDCTQYPSTLADYTCPLQQVFIGVQPQPAEIQISVLAQPNSGSSQTDLCTPLTYSLLLNSAQIANLSDALLQINLPNGLAYLPNSLSVEYPAASGNIQNVAPTLSGNLLSINLQNHTAIAQQGIKGTATSITANERQANINLAFITDCDFASGTGLNFRVQGNNPCGTAATGNNAIVATNPILLANAALPYTTTASIINGNIVLQGCNTPHTVRTQIQFAGGSTGAADTARIAIPAAALYVPASYACDAQTIADGFCPQFISANQNTILLKYPPNIPSGYTLGFQFDLLANAAAPDCGNETLSLTNNYQQSGLFCATSNSNCNELTVVSGTASAQVSYQKAILEVGQMFANDIGGGNIQIDGSISNASNFATQNPPVVEIYGTDALGNVITARLHAIQLPANILPNSTAAYQGVFNSPSFDNYLAVLKPTTDDGDEQCICLGARSNTLPLQLTDFQAQPLQKCQRQIYWQLQQPQQAQQIALLRSFDAIHFQAIAQFEAAAQQSFIDQQLLTQPDLYYQLRATNADGSHEYSPIRHLQNDCQYQQIAVFPNPADHNLHIVAAHNQQKIMHLSLLNPLGQQIQQAEPQTHTHTLNTSQLPAGSYILRLTLAQDGQSFMISLPFVIQH